MLNFELIMDEFGSLGSDKEKKPYGYGFCIVEKGAKADTLRDALRQKFNRPVHFRNYRKKRKLKVAKRISSILAANDAIHLGAHVFKSHERYSKLFFEVLAGVTESREKLGIDSESPWTPINGIIDPNAICPEAQSTIRLVAAYSALMRFPILGLVEKLKPLHEGVRIEIKVGEVGEKARFNRQLGLLAKPLCSEWESSISRLATGLKVSLPSCEIEMSTIESNSDPLFGVADMLANMAHSYHLWIEEQETFGKSFYRHAMPDPSKLLPLPCQIKYAPGITAI